MSFPSLTDDEWIWGGSLAEIHQTIAHGIRGRRTTRPAWAKCSPSGGQACSRRTRSPTSSSTSARSRSSTSRRADLAKGKELYATNCASCHGDEGKGNKEVGSPDLTDAIWLYGSSRQAMVETVTNGRAGAMPAWTGPSTR